MPVLQSPEVTVSPSASGLVQISQQIRTDMDLQADETDVGINDPAGLNVVCHRIHVLAHAVPGDCKDTIKMSLYLGEQWAQKDDFISRMKDQYDVRVSEDLCAYGSGRLSLSVRGQQNISKFCGELVGCFAETAHEGASIRRRVVNNALLIEAEGAVAAKVEESRNRKPSFNWAEAIRLGVETLGWRP